MVSRNEIIGICILVIVLLSFLIFLNMTGKAIMDSATHNKEVKNEYFRIDNFSDNINNEEDFNDTQNNSRSG